MVISSKNAGITANTNNVTGSGVVERLDTMPLTGFSKKIIDSAESANIAG
jgi:hypothetical protein